MCFLQKRGIKKLSLCFFSFPSIEEGQTSALDLISSLFSLSPLSSLFSLLSSLFSLLSFLSSLFSLLSPLSSLFSLLSSLFSLLSPLFSLFSLLSSLSSLLSPLFSLSLSLSLSLPFTQPPPPTTQIYIPRIPGVPDDIPFYPDRFGLDYEDVWLSASDGTKLHAWLVRPPGARPPRGPLLIFFQENAGTMAMRLPFLRLLVRHLGCAVLAPSYRG